MDGDRAEPGRKDGDTDGESAGSDDPGTPDVGALQGAASQPGRIARARETADQVESRARESFEQARTRFVAVRLASEAFEHDRARAGGLLAGGLAYRIFLWQIPLALFLLSAFGSRPSSRETIQPISPGRSVSRRRYPRPSRTAWPPPSTGACGSCS